MTTRFAALPDRVRHKQAIPIIVVLVSAPALQRSPFRRYLGIFSDRVEVGVDEEIMEQLVRGRKYAAGMAQDEESPEETGAEEESESKPN